MGPHGRRRRRPHGVGRMGGGVVPPPCADGCGVLLQLARRWPARYRRPAAEDVMDTNEPLRLNTPPAVPLLDIKNLTVEFATRRGIVRAVKNIDLQVGKGETVGIVGES